MKEGECEVGDHPYIMSAKELCGWGQKNDFADVNYYSC